MLVDVCSMQFWNQFEENFNDRYWLSWSSHLQKDVISMFQLIIINTQYEFSRTNMHSTLTFLNSNNVKKKIQKNLNIVVNKKNRPILLSKTVVGYDDRSYVSNVTCASRSKRKFLLSPFNAKECVQERSCTKIMQFFEKRSQAFYYLKHITHIL